MALDMSDVVGLTEISERLGVKQSTTTRWRYRQILPDPDKVIADKTPVWSWAATIVPWAIKTGRLSADYVTTDSPYSVTVTNVELPSADYQYALNQVEAIVDQLNDWLAKHRT